MRILQGESSKNWHIHFLADQLGKFQSVMSKSEAFATKSPLVVDLFLFEFLQRFIHKGGKNFGPPEDSRYFMEAFAFSILIWNPSIN